MIKISKMADIARLHLPRVIRKGHYRGLYQLHTDFNAEQLRQRYRFDRETIEVLTLTNEWKVELERSTSTMTALSVEQQVMIPLRVYGSGSQMQVVRETMGYDKLTVLRVIIDGTGGLGR